MKIFKIEKLNPAMTGTSAKREWKSRTHDVGIIKTSD